MHRFPLFFKWSLLFPAVAGTILFTGCNKLLDAGSPSNIVSTSQVYSSDSLAQGAIIGIYFKMMEGFGAFNGFMSKYPGISCDDLSRTNASVEDQPFLTNSLTIDNSF